MRFFSFDFGVEFVKKACFVRVSRVWDFRVRVFGLGLGFRAFFS